jgi:hypothetical protein
MDLRVTHRFVPCARDGAEEAWELHSQLLVKCRVSSKLQQMLAPGSVGQVTSGGWQSEQSRQKALTL